MVQILSNLSLFTINKFKIMVMIMPKILWKNIFMGFQLTAFENKRNLYEVMFLIYKSMHILKVYSITIYWDKTQILKNSIRTKKNVLFLLRGPTHHGFTFDLGFLYELKHKVRLSKIVGGIFHFWFRFVFKKV